jgi:hypothetical protein
MNGGHGFVFCPGACVRIVIMSRSYDDCDPDSVLPEQRLPFARVRLPPKANGSSNKVDTYVQDQEIEVFSSPGESEVGGWWRATIKVSLESGTSVYICNDSVFAAG